MYLFFVRHFNAIDHIVPVVWEMAMDFHTFALENGFLVKKRQEQSRFWMHETIREGIYNHVFNDPGMKKELLLHEKAISEGRMTSFMAAVSILNKYKSPDKS